MATEVGVCEVYRQPDGWWRWRWIPAQQNAEPLFSAHTFESEAEAATSAHAAFPGSATKTLLLAASESNVGGARRRRRLRLLTFLLAVLAVAIARRKGHQRRSLAR